MRYFYCCHISTTSSNYHIPAEIYHNMHQHLTTLVLGAQAHTLPGREPHVVKETACSAKNCQQETKYVANQQEMW